MAKEPEFRVTPRLMVGLGEEPVEVLETIEELGAAGCQVVTVGQYLRPTTAQAPVDRYWRPEEFAELERAGERLGLEVIAGPLVRSSYRAEEALRRFASGAAPPGAHRRDGLPAQP